MWGREREREEEWKYWKIYFYENIHIISIFLFKILIVWEQREKNIKNIKKERKKKKSEKKWKKLRDRKRDIEEKLSSSQKNIFESERLVVGNQAGL